MTTSRWIHSLAIAMVVATALPVSARTPARTRTHHAPDTLAQTGTAAASHDTTRVALPDPVLAEHLPAAIAARDSARVYAGDDRHRDAIRLYKRAIALYPPMTDDLAVELGHQYTWAEVPDSAMMWYQAALRAHPNDPEARIGIARLTSWKDDQDAARRIYQGVLADDPDNLGARLGLAQATNWSGRHREAADLYTGIIADHPDNLEAREGLARATAWMGRPDRARELAADSAYALPSVTADLDHDRAPGGSYTYEQNKDSDDVHRYKHTVRASMSTDDMTRLGAEYGHGKFTQPSRPDVSRNGIAAVLDRRFSASAAVHAALGYQWNSYDRSALGPQSYWQDDFNLPTLDSYVTVTPRDWTRMDFSLYHGSFENPDAIYRGISLTELGAGLDQRLRTNLLWASSTDVTWYSDVNTRFGIGTRAEWQPFWRMPIDMKHRFTSTTGVSYFGYQHTKDNGYYDPNAYWSIYEQVALDMTIAPPLRAHIAGRLSLENENHGDWFTAGSFEASASWAVWRGLGLTAGYYKSDSRVTSREGYQADGFYITVDYLHGTE